MASSSPALAPFSIVLPSASFPAAVPSSKTSARTGHRSQMADTDTEINSKSEPTKMEEEAEGMAQEENGEDEEAAKEKEEETKEQHLRDLVRLKRKRRATQARVSGPAWEAGVKNAAEWNAGVLRDRHLRGPWYWDPHSLSAQIYRSWDLTRIPSVTQLEALVNYLTPLTPDQQSAVLSHYVVGPTPASTAASSGATLTPSSTTSGDSSKKRNKRMRPKGPHCRMCLKEEPGDSDLMRCTECKDQYHPDCVELKKEHIPKMMSFGWRCMHCKKCETCKDTGDEEKLLFCDACDRGFHTFCLSPPLKRPPTGGWFCLECVQCKSCGSKTAGKGKSCRWHQGYTMCEQCFSRFKHNKYCPVCSLVYPEKDVSDPTLLHQCGACRRCVHAGCDNNFVDAPSPYLCPPCRKKGAKPKPEQTKRKSQAAVESENMEEDSPQPRKKVRKEKTETKKKADEGSSSKASGGNEDNEGRKTRIKSPSGEAKRQTLAADDEEKEKPRDPSPGGERRSRRLSSKAT